MTIIGVPYVVGKKPTYGELIDLLASSIDAKDLRYKFQSQYPHVIVGRRFFDTVQRIAAPTKLSVLGKQSLTGSQLSAYRKRIWEPRIRKNKGMMYTLFHHAAQCWWISTDDSYIYFVLICIHQSSACDDSLAFFYV